MRKYNLFTRISAFILCTSMILSAFPDIEFTLPLKTVETKAEEPEPAADEDEYANETLEHICDSNNNDTPDDDYWKAARSYYACAYDNNDKAHSGTFAYFGGVVKRTIFHVYAFEGETICLGSSVYNSGIGEDNKLKSGLTAVAGETGYKSDTHFDDEGSCDILMTDLKGNKIPIDIRNSDDDKTGYIESPNAEFAAVKMTMNANGTFNAEYSGTTYTPYTYKVKESGVYTFEFHSYDGTGTTNPDTAGSNARSAQWATADTNYITSNYKDAGGMIAALNITVFDENCKKQTGRTYADALSLQMTLAGKNVIDTYYVLTTDSYIYKMKFNNAAPYTYNFFANNRGIYDASTMNHETVYKSVKDLTNDNSFNRMGTLFVDPGTKETDKDKSFFIFLEYPDSDLEGKIYRKATLPDPATNIKFKGTVKNSEGETVPGTYEGAGGWFSFDIKEATTATLRLEFKDIKDSEGNVLEFAPVEITGPVTPNSSNSFYWNGCDGNGKLIPEGKYNFGNIMYTVTAKAGEIHFPIIDMECAPGGITFTRMSHIYDKEGERLDYDDNIYGKTKNVIYYDDSAIYYGEMVSGMGSSESEVDVAKTFFADTNNKGKYFSYNNVVSGGTEYNARKGTYINENEKTLGSNPNVRMGDHSHTTNVINYFDEDGEVLNGDAQKDMIEYLDSFKNPVGMSAGTGAADNANQSTEYGSPNKNSTTTDYGIANFWAFIPAKPAITTNKDDYFYIVDKPDDTGLFNLSARVFYDAQSSDETGYGIYDEKGANGEHLMSGVTLGLYKKTSDHSVQEDKKYFDYNDSTFTPATEITDNTYELVDTVETGLDGAYVFTNLEYDKTNGTKYLYAVKRPDLSYTLTSSNIKPAILYSKVGSVNYPYGYYANHSFDENGKGTEIQTLQIGGTGGIDPTKLMFNDSSGENRDNINNSVCTVDVGYHYDLLDKNIKLVKNWQTSGTTPATTVFELSYISDVTGSKSGVYNYYTLSPSGTWQKKDEFMPESIDGTKVKEYYVSAEYLIHGNYIYKYIFDFNPDTAMYNTFKSKAQKVAILDLGCDPDDFSITDLPDYNEDGKSDAADLGAITGWVDINETTGDYRAVIDRNVLSDSVELTVTNSTEHGTIEIFKHDDDLKLKNPLQGATFRLYKGEMEKIKALVGDKEKADELNAAYVGSATTRVNGRLTFTGLDPNVCYTVREMFAPDGFRISEEFYEVRPRPSTETTDPTEENVFQFNADNYAELEIGNAQADDSLRIRKQISGRAWQGGEVGTKDSFDFTISNEFNSDKTADLTSGSEDITLTDDEIGFLRENSVYADQSAILTELNNFAKNFQSDGTTAEKGYKSTIDYDSSYYSYTITDSLNKEVTYTSADTKMSEKLLDGSTNDKNSKPAFNGIPFPMAGTYTFTIREEEPDDTGSLEYSDYIYKVTISVVRKYNDPNDEEEDPGKTPENTHLEASVSKITYSTDGINFHSYISSSPLFTNTYKVAPAEQATSYNINKKFTGRDWKPGDSFTVEIKYADPETMTAIKNGNIQISGFTDPSVTKLADGGWKYSFTDNNHKALEFKSFKFNNIEFPVQYVHEDGKVWESADPDQTVPTKDEIETQKLKPQTMPVTYWLEIAEDIPTETKGITYDNNVYYLQIILRNAEKIVSSGSTVAGEEEDGIIDEIDMYLYHVDEPVADVKEITGDPVATCQTKAEVLTLDEWIDTPTPPEGGTYTWFYVDKRGNLTEDKEHSKQPDDAKLYVRRWEKHVDNIKNGHTMTFNNTYHTSYSWTPKITKILNGREWLEDDKFVFTMSISSPEGVEKLDDRTVTITKENKDKPVPFGTVEFTEPGEYTFTFTETAVTGIKTESGVDGSEEKQAGTYTMTVELKDDGNGKLYGVTGEGNEIELSDIIINFVNTYADKENSIAFNLTKTIEGRPFNDKEQFKFTITPSEDAKKAIDARVIEMPDHLEKEGDNYTYTVTANADSTWTLYNSLGNIIVNSGAEKLQQYEFTISEDTTGFKDMKCFENDILLTLNVERELDSTSKLPTGKLNVSATYAFTAKGDTMPKETTVSKIDIPFRNICMGRLTVGKEVFNDTAEDTDFTFNVEFTYPARIETVPELSIHNGEGSTDITFTKVAGEGNTYTGTFKLKNRENIVIKDMPYGTVYTIKEIEIPDRYFLQNIQKDTKDGEINEDGVSGTLLNSGLAQSVTFVNARYYPILPETGGNGRYALYALGVIMLLVSGILKLKKCKTS